MHWLCASVTGFNHGRAARGGNSHLQVPREDSMAAAMGNQLALRVAPCAALLQPCWLWRSCVYSTLLFFFFSFFTLAALKELSACLFSTFCYFKAAFTSPAAVGRGNTGWTTSKSGYHCPWQICSRKNDGKRSSVKIVLNAPLSWKTQSIQGLNWTELNRTTSPSLILATLTCFWIILPQKAILLIPGLCDREITWNPDGLI